MKELTIKEIAPYLPYGLKVLTDNGIEKVVSSVGVNSVTLEYDFDVYSYDKIKPILRSLSDLTKEVEHNGKKFVPIIVLYNLYNFKVSITDSLYYLKDFKIEEDVENIYMFDKEDDSQHFVFKKEVSGNPYWIVRRLLEWHFDIFSLIENGLAVDINTING